MEGTDGLSFPRETGKEGNYNLLNILCEPEAWVCIIAFNSHNKLCEQNVTLLKMKKGRLPSPSVEHRYRPSPERKEVL